MLAILNRHIARPIMAWRAGSRHLQYLRELRERQYDPAEGVRHRQIEAVRKLLFHAYETVPYYRRQFIAAHFHPGDLRSLDDLKQLPILTKADIRKYGHEMRSNTFTDQPTTLKKTSGSTGVPLQVAVNRDSIEWKTACTIRSDEWSGYRMGQRVAKVWGNPEYQREGVKGRVRNFIVDRATYLDTIGLDNDRMREFAMRLSKRRPGLLFGHAHSLYLFACYCRKHPEFMVRPNGIISTAMLLHDWQRNVIEEAFGCPVTNRYGCEEVSLIACECEEHRGLHLNADSLAAEVLDDRPGTDEGSLAVTDLTNYAMPLIRYKVGDVVTRSKRACACGRGLPLIEKVEGRDADFVLTPAGKLISGISLTENFALHIRGTSQVQIVQESTRHLHLRIVPDEQFGCDSEGQIEHLVRDTFGNDMQYDVELVNAIPQEASGKYRFCISNVANDYLQKMAS